MKDKKWLIPTWLLMMLILPLSGWGQGLTEEQYAKLKQDITVTHADEFSQAVANNNDQAIADAYNALQGPSPFWVWKTVLTEQEIYESTSPDAAAPTWSWSTYKAQSQQERDSWDTMLHPGKINPSLKQTRDSYNVIFGGQGASLTQNNYLLAISRRQARRIEALLTKTGTGNGAAATPADMGYEGIITRLDIGHALRGVPLQ